MALEGRMIHLEAMTPPKLRSLEGEITGKLLIDCLMSSRILIPAIISFEQA